MRLLLIRLFSVLSAVLMAASVSAQPQGLERVGPTSPANGFPTWYQDKTGLALEFCQPLTQAELDGGWCLLLPGDTTVPEAFPTQFSDEHFFFAADATIDGIGAKLVIGLEAAFAVGPPIAGDQLVFARIRFVIPQLPVTGVYTIQHPYGTDQIQGVAGERLFWTEDVGIDCRGAFDCALGGRIGPFLLPSNAPGGAELPAVPGPVAGKFYIADPARLGPVTGSPVGQNYFRVINPDGTVLGQTNDFALMGRIFQGTMPGRLTINRASYSRSVELGKVDVFATANATTPTRMPATAPAPVVLPLLDFFPAACSVGVGGVLGAPPGIAALPMVSEGSRYYGQQENGTIPAAVCVRDNTARDVNGQIAPIYREAPVVDEVRIAKAEFNPAAGGVLRVEAISSDGFAPPQLTALIVGPLTGAPLAAGEAAVVAPPESVAVTSARGGRAVLDVSTVAGPLAPPARPFAGNDVASMNEDAVAALVVNVLANDTIGGRPIAATDNPVVTIVGAARLGVATVNADQTISYLPGLNANGTDLITYTVTVGAQVSSPAFLSISVLNVNDPPVAVNDVANGVAGLGISLNLLANDTDVDGAADLAGVQIVTAPAGVVWSVAGGTLSISAGAGTYAFTYRARDAAGALSANTATATFNLSGPVEVVTIIRSEYISSKRRWRVEGTSSVAGNQTVFVMYADGVFADGTTAAGHLIGTTQVDAVSAWAVDFALAGTNDPRNPTNTTLFAVRPTRVVAITSLGGTSPTANINVR